MLSDLFIRVRAVFRRKAVERELDQEIRFHLEHSIAKHASRGLSNHEAFRQAALDLRGLEQAKEYTRDARGVSLLENTFRDLRYSLRSLRRTPAFTVVAILSLALGIGANSAIFQLLDAIRLRTLPVYSPEQLSEVRVSDMSVVRGSRERTNGLTYPLWEQIRARQQSFSGMFAWADDEINLSPSGQVRPVRALWISGDFFAVLGIHPRLGRLFTRADDYRGCPVAGAVISYPFWQSEFSGSAKAIGSELTLVGHRVPVIGVTPADFFGMDIGRGFQIALPVCAIAPIRGYNVLDAGTEWWLSVFGRAASSTTIQQASQALNQLSPGIFASTLPAHYPAVSVKDYLNLKLSATAAPNGMSELRNDYSRLLWLSLVLAGTVLLIACANLGNLMLARADARASEIAIRLAIGGSHPRIIRQLLVESGLIGMGGALGALLLSQWLAHLLLALFAGEQSAAQIDLRPDWRVFGFMCSLALASCLLFGLLPALRSWSVQAGEALKSRTRTATAAAAALRLRRILIVLQVALSFVLLIGALFFVRNLQSLLSAKTGFEERGLLVADLRFIRSNPGAVSVIPWQKSLLEQVGNVPGVVAVADTVIVPLAGNSWSDRIWRDGADFTAGSEAHWSRISSGYFHTLRIPILAGRDFNAHDDAHAPKVAIVNAAFARQVFHTDNPVGAKFRVEATPSTPEENYQIVGVVGNTKYADIHEPFQPQFYLPLSQDSHPTLSDQLVIRSQLPLSSVRNALARAILRADPEAHFELYDFKELFQESLAPEHLMSKLASGFAVLAMLLSTVGLYGVITYLVVQRKNEIAIRLALGANRRSILGMVLREMLKLLGLGFAAGAALALAAATFSEKLRLGVRANDPANFASAAAILLLAGLLAAYLPAARASRTEPGSALRDE